MFRRGNPFVRAREEASFQHDLCVAVVVILLDEVVRHFRQDLSILLIICQINSLGHLFDRSGCSFGRNNR